MLDKEKSPSTAGQNQDLITHNEVNNFSHNKKIIVKIPPGHNSNDVHDSKGIYSATELLNRNIEEIPCLVEPIFPKVGLVALAGGSDTGKSSLLRQFAISICIGESKFLGFRINSEYKNGIYVSTEDDEYAISFLLNKANKERCLNANEYKGLTFIFDTHNLLEKMDNQLSKQKRDFVIIDAFADLYGKSMNDTNQVRAFLNDYSQLAQKHKCLIIFLHHTGKRTEDLAPSKHNLLGSQGFEAKMRLVIELRADNTEPSKRHLCIVKGNYLPKEYKTESFVLLFNENLQFSMTNEKRLFEELKSDNKIDIKEKVKAMKEGGKTQTEIACELKISQATVSRYLKE